MTNHPPRARIALLVAFLAALIGCEPDTGEVAQPREWNRHAKLDLAVPEPSGLTWDLRRNHLWTVSDRTGRIYHLALDGTVLDSLPWVGDDPEGIALDLENNLFMVLEEYSAEVVLIDSTGSEQSRFPVSSAGASTNEGLEGIAWSPASLTLTVLKEKAPITLIVLDQDGTERSRRILDIAEDVSGAAWDPVRNALWLVSDEDEAAYLVDELGEVLDSFEHGVDKAEGIAVHGDSLFVVSDSKDALYLFLLN